jgi:hypothetical protein
LTIQCAPIHPFDVAVLREGFINTRDIPVDYDSHPLSAMS